MGFRRYASVQSIATASYDAEGTGLRRVAFDSNIGSHGGASAQRALTAESYFVDGTRKIDVRAYLAAVADKYKISDNPSDYIFEAIRANSTNVPNENHDAFHRDELLRFDTRYVSPFGDKVGMPVYMTYVGKPHHMQHQASDPTRSRGVILDSHYNDETPALEYCPQPGCGHRTASVEDRDVSGIHCAACGTVVKDEFVEILVAVDSKKDPDLVRGMQAGILNAGSMGCNCASTVCNVCDHVARSTRDFCDHIKGANKGTLWLKQGEKFVKTSADEVRRKLKDAGWSPVGTGNQLVSVSLVIPGTDFEVRKGFENCRGVEFEEYSKVHKPADPKARTIELLKAAHSTFGPISIQEETQELIRQAQLARIAETNLTKLASKTPNASTYFAVRVNGNDEDIHVAASLAGAIKAAGLGKRDTAEYLELTAESEKSALTRAIAASVTKTAQYLPMDADVQLVVPEGMKVRLDDPNDPNGGEVFDPNDPNAMPGAPGAGPVAPGAPGAKAVTPPGPKGIEEVTQQSNQPRDQSPEEFGMMPPGASAPAGMDQDADMSTDGYDPAEGAEDGGEEMSEKYASVYGDVEVDLFGGADSKAVVRTAGGPVFTAHTPADVKSKADLRAFGMEVCASLLSRGLVRTAKHFNASFDKRVADSLEGLMTTLSEKPSMGSGDATEGLEEPLKDKRPAAGDTTIGGSLDGLIEATKTDRKMPANSIESRDDALVGTKVESPKSSTEGLVETLKDSRPSFSVGSENSLDGLEKAQKAAAQNEERLRKLYAARLEKEKAEYEQKLAAAAYEVEQLETKVAEKFSRALKVVAKRRALNMEESPLKAQMFDSLTITRPIGRDAQGHDLEYVGLDDGLALHLVEAAWADSIDSEVETLVSRAAELMSHDETYFKAAEHDLARQAAFVPPVVTNDSDNSYEGERHEMSRTAAYREQLSQGNFILPPTSVDSAGGDDNGLKAAVRRMSVSRPLVDFGYSEE